MQFRAKLYIATILGAGALCLGYGAGGWNCADPLHYAAQLFTALIASGLKVRLPGILSTMSVSYVFVVLSLIEFSFPETVLLACAATATQCLCRPNHRPKLLHIAFNVASMALSVSIGYSVYHLLPGTLPVRVGLAAASYFLSNTLAIAGVVALTEGKSLRRVYKECYFWSFPYYLVGGGVAALLSVCNHRVGWQTVFLGLPVVYVIFRSYRLYLGKLESEKDHAEQIAGLHLRTIEALALAIEAKDDTTHEHLQRVQVYALELGKKMGLEAGELQALRAASILHDIGKLAIPEHIISKPGKLTPEEFEKMKIHPIVGAEILARVQFPYSVVPIVRSHHEKWDGSGYPDGLKGEEIPLGARVLAAVDCLDALASDRQYRRALPLRDAMAAIAKEAGSSFDPAVVAVLKKHYQELERNAQGQDHPLVKPSTDVKVSKGSPAAGLEHNEGEKDVQTVVAKTHQVEFLSSIASARQEAQMLFE